MLQDFLPKSLMSAVNKLPINNLNEIRLRVEAKILVYVAGKYYYLSDNGLTSDEMQAIKCDKQLLIDIVSKATERSLYAVNYQLKQGFLTLNDGIRIGLSGEIVQENNKVKTIKNISSINIRVPHQVRNCSLNAFKYIVNEKFYNTLIISPPGCGKTTFIRDIVYQLYKHRYCYNVLICDERYELCGMCNGQATMNLGEYCDVLSGGNKQYLFENGVRSMRPDIIVTDEIANMEDVDALEYLAACGVGIIASAHCESVEMLRQKPNFARLINNKIFNRYIVLDNSKGPGTYKGIYDENLNFIYY